MINIDLESDFYRDPEIKILFKEEYDNKVPSHYMWALVMTVHPDSKFSDLNPEDAKDIIYKDYLNSDPKFKWEDYSHVIPKIIECMPTMAKRFLATWKKKLGEIISFINYQPYNENTAEMLSKIMKDFHPMMKQYREIEKEYDKETQGNTRGAIEESLSEKGII